jgi:hypothetical protein
MSGVVARLNETSKNQSGRASGLASGALSHVQLERINTGQMVGDLHDWVERREAHQRLADDTERMADLLEAWGVSSRQAETVTALGMVTGQVDRQDTWRNVNVLPAVSSRNRRPVLKALEYWMANHGQGWGRWRYAVVTSGTRVPLFGDLRQRVQDLHRRVSRWAAWAREHYGIEVIHRQGELTVDERLSLHPHSNVLYRPTRRLPKAEWARFLMESRCKLGAHWHDAGTVKKAAEVIKYMVKGDDLALMLDAACMVDEWADGDCDGRALARTMAARISAKTKRPVSSCLPEGFAAVSGLVTALRHHAKGGQPHPLVWLAHELKGLHLGQSYGPFRDFLAECRNERLKVATVFTARGARLQLVRKRVKKTCVESHLSDADQALHDLVFEAHERVPEPSHENQVLCIQAPAPRFGPWLEPVAIIANYTATPRTRRGENGLVRLQESGVYALQAWHENGAPPPEVARRRTQMVLSATDGGEGGPARSAGCAARGSDPYSPHMYENCPGLDDVGEDELEDDAWTATPFGFVNTLTGEIVENECIDEVIDRIFGSGWWQGEVEGPYPVVPPGSEWARAGVPEEGQKPVYWWQRY